MTHATRDALRREIIDLNEQIRERSFALCGPMALPPDLTMRQLHALLAAEQSDGVTVHQLATMLDTSSPTASGLVDRLVAKGLVTRVEDEDDRRVRHIRLTDAGQDTLAQFNSAYVRLIGELLEHFDSDELVTFRDNAAMVLTCIDRARAKQGL